MEGRVHGIISSLNLSMLNRLFVLLGAFQAFFIEPVHQGNAVDNLGPVLDLGELRVAVFWAFEASGSITLRRSRSLCHRGGGLNLRQFDFGARSSSSITVVPNHLLPAY